MKSERVAIKYAKAVLQLAKTTEKIDSINADMLLIKNSIESSKDLKIMLKSPIIKADAKQKVLKAIFGDKVDKMLIFLFGLLAKNKRLPVLASVAKQYTSLCNHYKGVQMAKVITAVPLTKDLAQQIQEKIATLTTKKVTIANTVDSTILGGFILRLGDVQYDASIAHQFKELKKGLNNNYRLSVN